MTPSKWPYRAANPLRRRRVIKVKGEPSPGVVRPEPPRPVITPAQARMVLAAAMLFALLAGAWWAYHSPWLTVSKVRVNGTSRLTAEQVRDAADLDGDSTFSLDLAGAESRVAALPGVRSVRVAKEGLSAIRITVEERVAWGSWQVRDTAVPIDIDGNVLEGTSAADGSPVIRDVAESRAIRAGDVLDAEAIQLADRLVREADSAFGRHVINLLYREHDGLTVVLSGTDNGPALWVRFGDGRDYDYKVAALYVLIERARTEKLALNVVDLRYGDRISFQ